MKVTNRLLCLLLALLFLTLLFLVGCDAEQTLLAAEEADLTSFTPAEAEAFSELYETMKTRVGEISALLLCGVGGALLYVTKAYLLPRLPSTCPALARLLHRGETEKSPPEELPPDPVFCEDDTDEV